MLDVSYFTLVKLSCQTVQNCLHRDPGDGLNSVSCRVVEFFQWDI